MATTNASTKARQRKHSFGQSLALLNRTRSMTDQTLLGVLSILRMDEGQGQSFMVKAILPDGKPRLLSAERNNTIRELVSGICQEYNLSNYQVRTLPEKTLLNLEALATTVENAEIAIEDVEKMLSNFQLDNLHTIEDPRLRCVKELVYAEEIYNECLKNLLEFYAEPLRSKMSKAEHHTLFATVEPICPLNASLYQKLEEAASNWNSASTGIGAIYVEYPLFWDLYRDYYLTFKFARALMRQKRESDSEFMSFVHSQRAFHRPQLDALLLKPVQHVVECERILSNLLEKTPETHRDYNELSKVAARFKQMVKGREEELHEAENECKLYGIQDRFPSDNLYLSEKQNSHRSKAPPRRRSVSATVIKAALGSKTHSTKSSTVDGSMRMKTAEPNFPLSSELIPARIFIKEGPVVLQSSSMPSQDRYLVLFDDILLVAKLRSATSLKLKHRVRVSEIWLAGCVDHVCDSVRAQDNSFVIGWPTTNFVVSFNTAEEKEAWYTALAKQIKEKKELEDPKSVSLKVYNRDMVSPDSCGYSKSFSVSNMDDAASVVKMSQAIFNIQTDDPSEYQLWVVSGKVGDAYTLIGHEFPFAIKMNHMREAAMADDDGFHFPLDYEQQLPAMDPLSPETQCQFILKRNEKMTNRIPIDVQNAPSRQRWRNPIRRSQIMNWAQKRSGSSKSNTIDVQSPGKLFGLPLNQLCSDEELVPKAVMELLLHLFRYGSNTTGIFRKSANAKTAKEVKLELDEGKVVDFEGISEIVAASVMKEFLRRLPDCIFESENYEDLVATNTLQDREERVRQIKGILDGINAHNYELLKRFLCVLYHIADNAEINNMNAYNLAVCISPSMLWAPNSSNIPPTEQSNVVPPVIQFLIEHCVEIMGDKVKTVLGDRSEIAVNHVTSDSESGIQDSRTALSQSSTDDGIESPEPLSPKGERNSIHSSDSNLYVPSTLAVSPPKKSASSPNSPCDSGIPSPNSSPTVQRRVEFSDQLNAALCEPGKRKGQSTACRRNSEPLGSPPDSLKLRLKGSRKFPNCKRQLSSTTTSAELIEHKQTPKTTASGRKLETAVLRRAHSPQTVRLFPVTQYQRLNPIPVPQGSLSRALEVKPGLLPRGSSCDTHEGNVTSQVLPSSPVSKQTPGAPRSSSPSPDQVFQAVDRRRQPAAPSYQEHMQRRRELVSRPALFAGSEGKEMIDSEREQESPGEKKELDEHGEHVQQVLLSSKAAALGERLDSERSETSSGPRSPLSPTSQPEYVWEQVDDSSSSSVGVSSGLRKLEHSPFGLNLHHKRQASEGSYEKPNTENSKKPLSVLPCSNTGHLRVCPTSVSITITNSVAQNSSLTHFPSSEIFPHEAQTKTHWSPSVDTRVTSAIPISNSHGALRLRAGSTTSSSSSVSSLDEQSSICHDSTPPESKTDVTQIRDIKELLCETKHANGLKISPQTAQAIAKVRTPHSQSGPYPVPSHHDMEKILSTEESYV
ncbi:uncharacterized protein LOC141884261 isoform X1 [Acropora palmata]|uniref:uncharacterized protein LOC141884261 isoform X1 n=1 Tax=Acropora palmata TaxID=6131 RepID=UPI003DA182BE